MNKLQNLQKHERKRGRKPTLLYSSFCHIFGVLLCYVHDSITFQGPIHKKRREKRFFFCKFSFSIIFRFFLLLRSGVHCIIDQQDIEITLDIRFSVFIDIQ